jgi:hypothetical protein
MIYRGWNAGFNALILFKFKMQRGTMKNQSLILIFHGWRKGVFQGMSGTPPAV